GDIGAADSLATCFSHGPVDAVFHAAARAGVRPSISEPASYMRVNVQHTASLAEAMLSHGCKRMVFASSSSVFGAQCTGPLSESAPKDRPVSPYAASKRAAELALYAACATSELSVTTLRFFTVYGPRQRPTMAFHKFATMMSRGQPVTLYGDGTTARDYTYVGDVVTAVVSAIDRVDGYAEYNIGSNSPVTLIHAVEELADALNVEPTIVHLPDQAGDVPHTWANPAAARQALGLPSATSLKQGLRLFARWFECSGVR
ncbi:MAG TPA: hypothetical protein DCQ06_08520, partial [Myxococcales bacterium]|nr:hypothetical protein [Myxococcales bacterium]